MAPISGKYEYVSNENLVEYLIAIGAPADRAEQAKSRLKELDVNLDGNKVTIDGDRKGSVLVIGEEIDEPLPTGVIGKTRTELSGSTLTLTVRSPNGKTGTRRYEFSDDGLVVTMTGDYHSVVGKLYYKRV